MSLSEEKDVPLVVSEFNGFELKMDNNYTPNNRRNIKMYPVDKSLEEDRTRLIEDSFDPDQIDKIIQIARSYPNASSLGYLSWSDDEFYICAILGIQLSNGEDNAKMLFFPVEGRSISLSYKYLSEIS